MGDRTAQEIKADSKEQFKQKELARKKAAEDAKKSAPPAAPAVRTK